jgi:hypothetical protein
MDQNSALRSGVAGVGIGSLSAGGMWWAEGFLSGSFVLIAAVGIVWAAAIASTLYVFQSRPGPRDAGPWGSVIGGSLLFGIILNLSDINISNDVWAALTVLAIGFTTLGYAAGMATVSRQVPASQTSEETEL